MKHQFTNEDHSRCVFLLTQFRFLNGRIAQFIAVAVGLDSRNARTIPRRVLAEEGSDPR